MCTASHNPKAYTGAKLVREGALALSGDAGIGEMRDLCAAGLPPAGRPRRAASRRSTSPRPSGEHVLSFVDVGAIRPMKVVLDGGNGMAGPMVGPLLERIPGLELVRDLLGARRRVPRPRAEPAAAGEPALRDRQGPQRGRRPRHRLGRRRRPLLLHRRRRRVRRRRLRLRAARPRRAGEAPRRGDPLRRALLARGARHGARGRRHAAHQPRRPRLLQDAACARRAAPSAARSPATTTSPTSTTPTPGRCPRCSCSSCSAAPAGRSPSCSSPTARATSSRARSTPRSPTRRPSSRSIRARYADADDHRARRDLGRLRRLALQRARRRTPSRSCACASRASSRASDMEARRDEVLRLIRS